MQLNNSRRQQSHGIPHIVGQKETQEARDQKPPSFFVSEVARK